LLGLDSKIRGRRLWGTAAIIFVLALILRLPGYSDQPVMPDELNFFQPYAYSIIAWGWQWPVKYMYIHPPLYPYILALATVLAGGSLEVLRLSSVLFASLTPVFLFLLGRELYGWRAGLLGALLLCFSSFHILYSRVLMLEAPLICFLTAGLYLFARSLREREVSWYAFGAGIVMGLAIITKWIAVLYAPALLLFLALTKRSLRGLLDRRVGLVFIISGLVALPCFADLWLHGVNPVNRNLGIGTPPVVRLVGFEETLTVDLVMRGLGNYIDMTVDAASQAAGMIPWQGALTLIAGVIFFLTMANAIYGSFKGKGSDALLFSIFVVLNGFVAIYGKRFQYYLVWTLPTYLLLASATLMDLIGSAANSKAIPKMVGLSGLAVGSVFLTSVLAIGMLAPFANGGPSSGLEAQVLAMRPRIQPGDTVAASLPESVNHYLEEFGFEPFRNNIVVVPLNKRYLSPLGFVEELDMDIVLFFQPRFILTNRYYYDSLAGSAEVRAINEHYRLVSEIDENMLFERAAR